MKVVKEGKKSNSRALYGQQIQKDIIIQKNNLKHKQKWGSGGVRVALRQPLLALAAAVLFPSLFQNTS
jgi:hypothetical protein